MTHTYDMGDRGMGRMVVESRYELDAGALSSFEGQIDRLCRFLKDLHITWCRGLILKGSGRTGDVVEGWSVALADSVDVICWIAPGNGLMDLLWGRALLLGGEGYTVIDAEKVRTEEIKPAVESQAERHKTAREAFPVPEKVRKDPPQARVIEKRSATVFPGRRGTGIPSLDRFRGGIK